MDYSTSVGRELQDAHFQIKDLIVRHAHAMDHKDAEAFKKIWHSDATYISGSSTHSGLESIMASAAETWSFGGRSWHFPANIVIDFTAPAMATAISTLAAIATSADGPAKYFLGSYSDSFEKRRGVWRFSSREVEIVHIGEA